MAKNIYSSVAERGQDAAAIASILTAGKDAASDTASVIALEKDIAITRKFFDAMEEPRTAFHGLAHLSVTLDEFPTPSTLAESVELLDSSVTDKEPVAISVLLIDRILMQNEPGTLKRHLGLISHPRFLIQTLYVRAVMAVQANQWETAFKELELLRTFAPHSREVLYWLGRYYLRDRQLAAAEHFDAEFSFQDIPWTRREVDAAAVITAHEDYRGHAIQFRGGEYVAVDLGKQRIVDLNNTRASVLLRIVFNEILFRIRRRLGIKREEAEIRASHLHEAMNAVDRKLDG